MHDKKMPEKMYLHAVSADHNCTQANSRSDEMNISDAETVVEDLEDPSASNEGVYGVSRRGSQTFIYRGYEFWRLKDMTGGRVVWRCSQSNRNRCKASVVTKGVVVVSPTDDCVVDRGRHNHAANRAAALARQAVGEMKRILEESLATPKDAQASVLAGLPRNVLRALPKKTALSRTLQRHRHVASASGGVASSCMFCQIRKSVCLLTVEF